MLDRIPVKKDYLLLAGIVLTLMISYLLAFKPTFVAWSLHRELQQQLDKQSGLDYQPAYLERKNKNLDRVVADYRMDSTQFRTMTINRITALASTQQVSITNLPADDPGDHRPEFIVQRLDMEGHYFSLLNLLNMIEKSHEMGAVRSVDIRRKPLDYQSRPLKDDPLTATLWMEMIK